MWYIIFYVVKNNIENKNEEGKGGTEQWKITVLNSMV